MKRSGWRSVLFCLVLLMVWWGTGALEAGAQNPDLFASLDQEMQGQGWEGFRDLDFILGAMLTLLLATGLGAIIAFHPQSKRTRESIEDVETPKIFIIYGVVGAVTGILVHEFGAVVGFVVFGIGGLIRFRSNLRSPSKTGRVIFVTLVGLCCGLNLPHVAVLSTVFGFVLIYILDARASYRIVVKGLGPEVIRDAADSYRSVLEEHGSRILSENKDFRKSEVAFIFRAARHLKREDLEHLFEVDVPEDIQGAIDWETG